MVDATAGGVAARLSDRAQPRVASAVAGAGCLVAYFGTNVVSGDALGGGADGGSQIPGIIIMALMVAGGLALVAKAPGTAFATAGSFTAILSVPPLVFYLTFDRDGFPGYSTEGVLLVSAVAWIAMHLVGPAAGRTFPLGAGLIAGWMFLLELAEQPFTAPFDFFSLVFDGAESSVFDDEPDGSFDGSFSSGFDTPDPTVLGILSLAVGIGFAWAGLRLHRRGQAGRATAFVVAAAIVLPWAVVLLAPDLEAVGSGLLLIALGLGLAVSGAAQSRRATTWLGAVGCFLGVSLIVGELVGDSDASAVGGSMFVAGALLVVAAHVLSGVLGEPDELEPVPSPLPGGPDPSSDAGGRDGGVREF